MARLTRSRALHYSRKCIVGNTTFWIDFDLKWCLWVIIPKVAERSVGYNRESC